jgi:hypothetical protein
MDSYRFRLAFRVIGLAICLTGCIVDGETAEPTVATTAEAFVDPTATPYPIGYPYIANVTDSIAYTFAGQVKRGQLFEQEIGTNLLFCLLPDSFYDPGGGGWRITVTTKSDQDCSGMASDYVGLVSPPFHGPNWILIEGWHFRNADNSGPNDGSVNALQENRWFNFLLTEADYQTVRAAGSCLSWNDCGEIERDEAEGMIAGTPISSGQLVITDLELGNLEPGQQAWVEQMSFEVEVWLPE